MDDATRLHNEAVVCDLHVDTLQRLACGETLASNQGHIDLPRLRQGGVDLLFFAAWLDPVYQPRQPGDPDRSFGRTCELIDVFEREMSAHPDAIAPVRSAAEARRAVAGGRVAAALGVEGGQAIENDLEKLTELHRRGARYLSLTWNKTLDWVDAAKEESEHGTRHGGLTEFGEQVVRRMNQLGMIVDLSHAAESTFWHVLRLSEAPVMASHSNAWTLTPHFRNLKDEQIRALAARGGLVGINFYSAFLDAEFSRRHEQAEERRKAELDAIAEKYAYEYIEGTELERRLLDEEMGHVPVAAARIADHIEHIVRLVGPEHVALGTDFDGVTALPDDLQDVAQMPRLTQLLHGRGLADSDIRKILGENVLRLFETVCG